MNQNLKNEIIELAKQLATPIDFEQLEKDGILEKKRAWFKVKDLKSLPEHVSRQVKSIKVDNQGNCLVQLPKSWTKSQKLYHRMVWKE